MIEFMFSSLFGKNTYMYFRNIFYVETGIQESTGNVVVVNGWKI